MTQKEIDYQKKSIEKILKNSNGSLSNCQKWDIWNYILNTVRQVYGKPLVNRLNNPYLNAEAKENIMAMQIIER